MGGGSNNNDDALPSSHIRALIEAGRLDDALAAADAALATTTGNERVLVQSLKSLAEVTHGDAMDGMRTATEAHEYALTLGEPMAEAEALLAIGFALQSLEDHARAIDAITHAERLAKQAGDAAMHARALRRLGISCSVLGRHEQAAGILQQAAAVLEQHGAVAEWCHARFSVLNARSRAMDADSSAAEEKAARYRQLHQDWRAFADDMSERNLGRLQAMATGNSGIAARHAGDLELAMEVLEKATAMHASAHLRGHQAVTQNHLGAVLLSLGRKSEAIVALQRGIELLEGGSPREQMEAWNELAEAHESVDDARAALAAFKKARSFEQKLHDDDARVAAARREQREEIARLADQWSRLAEQDALTGIANRRAFDRDLARMIEGAAEGAHFSLLVIDLDHFKRINDRFGHAIGDAVLRRFGALLADDRRGGDQAARIGGEEFALLLPCGLDDAVEVAARLQRAVRATSWSDISPQLAVTVSIGIAASSELASDALLAMALFECADRRLYLAKNAGRDRAVSVG
jgi:diguanylate cyclase (GGDEF)-like protein